MGKGPNGIDHVFVVSPHPLNNGNAGESGCYAKKCCRMVDTFVSMWEIDHSGVTRSSLTFLMHDKKTDHAINPSTSPFSRFIFLYPQCLLLFALVDLLLHGSQWTVTALHLVSLALTLIRRKHTSACLMLSLIAPSLGLSLSSTLSGVLDPELEEPDVSF